MNRTGLRASPCNVPLPLLYIGLVSPSGVCTTIEVYVYSLTITHAVCHIFLLTIITDIDGTTVCNSGHTVVCWSNKCLCTQPILSHTARSACIHSNRMPSMVPIAPWMVTTSSFGLSRGQTQRGNIHADMKWQLVEALCCVRNNQFTIHVMSMVGLWSTPLRCSCRTM